MSLTPEDQAIADAARDFVTRNRRRIARELTDLASYPAEKDPVAVFMAGSPGAGKTEASQALIKKLAGSVLRVDPDDYRALIPGYNGKNSNLFQRAVSRFVEKVLDEAFAKGQSFILDGTLSNYEVASRNVSRALARGTLVRVFTFSKTPVKHGDLSKTEKHWMDVTVP